MRTTGKLIPLLVLTTGLATVAWQRKAISMARLENETRQKESQIARTLARDNAAIEQLRMENREIATLRTENQELYRLRNEVRQLREQTRELPALHAENERLRSRPSTETAARSNESSPAVIISKNSLKFAGYATPEASLQTMFWSMGQGDARSLVRCFSPNAQPKLEEQLESEGLDEMKREFEKFTSIQIAARKTTSAETMLLGIRLQADDAAGANEIGLPFRLVDGEWKIDVAP